MPVSPASLGALVHPHQMEVQDFSLYALVIDARRPEAFVDDHIPGAVNVPCDDSDAAPSRVAESGPRLRYELAARTQSLPAGAAVLVYCDRGGIDAESHAAPLRAEGFQVDVLGGGWANYRRWVTAGLVTLPRARGKE